MPLRIRTIVVEDEPMLVALRAALWPQDPLDEHAAAVRAIVEKQPRSTLPLELRVAELDDVLVGFVEVGLRSHAKGCDPTRPVGYVEGWYVTPDQRGSGVGRALMQAAADWARERGCRELASDTWIEDADAQRGHLGVGFEEVHRTVCYRKSL